MSEHGPTWAQTMGRMAAVGMRSAHGVVSGRNLDRTGDGPAGETRTEFWHAAPSSWRVEDEAGVLHVQDEHWVLVRDGRGRMQRRAVGSIAWRFGGAHPWALFGDPDELERRFTRRDDFSVPTGPAEPVEVAGRRCWEYVLAPPARKPHALRVAVDDATGTVLRLAVPEVGVQLAAEEFHPDVDVPPGSFTWDGPFSTAWRDADERQERTEEWLATQSLPVPRWWPAGARWTDLHGDPDTGALSAYLELPGDPLLGRWPLGGRPDPQWTRHTEGRHVHRWNDERWSWGLAVREPLTEEDLARVVASIPADD